MNESTAVALPLRARLAYASSSLGTEALGQSRGLWLVYFYAPPEDSGREALVPLGLIGVILFAARLVETFDDALVGYLSDRTSSRLGRRLPYVLGATPFMALFSFLLFAPPRAGTGATVAYLFLMLELYYVFSTLSGGPYEALLPEIATTSAERVGVVGMRVYFGVAGAAVGLVGSSLIVDHLGFKAMALVMAVLAFAFRYLGAFGVWRHARRGVDPVDLPFWEALRTTFSNVYFLLFLPTFVLFQIGLQMLLGVLPYYVDAVLGVEDEGTWVAALTAVAIGSMAVSVPLFARLARRTSKRQAYRTAMLAAALVFPLLAFAGFVPGVAKEVQIVAAMVLLGAPVAGVYLFPATLTADIIDYDALRTGLRREATYYGAQNFVEKTATSLAPLVLTLLLLLGRSAENPLGIRLVGPVAGVILLAGYLVFRAYDLSDDVTAAAPGTPRLTRASA